MPVTRSAPAAASPKRDHLMDTAWRLFYRDGYRAVGIDTILAEAGVAKMTLYHHFASKEELIVTLLDTRSREIIGALAASVERASRSPSRRLMAVFDWLRAWLENPDFKGCAFIRALSEYPEPDHAIHRAALRHKRAFSAELSRLAEEAEVLHPVAFAEVLSLLIDGAIVAAHAADTPDSAEAARAAAASLLKLETG